MMSILIDLGELFEGDRAIVSELPEYMKKVLDAAGRGNDAVLTGRAPVWLYLKAAHELHGTVRRLYYRSPALNRGDILIFDHNPYVEREGR